MLKLTELIDKYLLGELNAQELSEFEDNLKTNTQLQKELEIHKTLLKGIELGSIHKQVNLAQKSYLIKTILIKTVVTILIAVGIGTLTYLATRTKTDQTSTSDILKEQNFTINVNQDTLLETQNGMVFVIPAHAFDTKSDSVEIKIEEALDAASIMMKGLSTVSDSLLLETAGMFKFDASAKGNKVNIIKEITASLPTDKVDKDMMLFKGEEDSKGNINWVNPQKIQQELVTYDIEKLNFFPKGYLDIIDTLYQIKGINEESKRIYFEMSGYCRQNKVKENDELMSIDFTGNFIGASFTQTSNTAIVGNNSLGVISNCEIDPSRIRVVWDKKYNHTLLATKNFEERLQFIFTTCNPDLLDPYFHHLDKPLFFIDSLCTSMVSGAQREKFMEFYHRKDGEVRLNNNAMLKLHRHYEKKYLIYKNAAAKAWKTLDDKNEKADQKFVEKATENSINESARGSEMYEDELCKNLTNAYAQIGKTYHCNTNNWHNPYLPQLPQKEVYTFQINATGWYNLDAYVTAATLQRKSLNYTDPESGKKAIITYSDCKIVIEDFNEFDLVNVYSLPDKLKSFQKIRQKDGAFIQSLNMSFLNDIVVVAKKGKDWYWYSIQQAQGKTYTFTLIPIKEFQLQLELNRFNRSKEKDIMEDMAYYAYAEEYLKDLKKRNVDMEQKRRIAKVIFPCMNVSAKTPKGVSPQPGSPDQK